MYKQFYWMDATNMPAKDCLIPDEKQYNLVLAIPGSGFREQLVPPSNMCKKRLPDFYLCINIYRQSLAYSGILVFDLPTLHRSSLPLGAIFYIHLFHTIITYV